MYTLIEILVRKTTPFNRSRNLPLILYVRLWSYSWCRECGGTYKTFSVTCFRIYLDLIQNDWNVILIVYEGGNPWVLPRLTTLVLKDVRTCCVDFDL